MKRLSAVAAAVVLASISVVGVAQWRQASAASTTHPYFDCPTTAALCVEPLQFQSTLPEIHDNDQAETRTATVFNNTSGPVTITGYKILNDTKPYPTFEVWPNETCVGRTLQPGDECGINVNVMLAGRPQYRDPSTATLEVDATAGSGAGAQAVSGTALMQVYEPIRPDSDLTTIDPRLEFSVGHVGMSSTAQTLTLSGYGTIAQPPIHVHVGFSGPSAAATPSGPPPGFDSLWYRVIGATVIDDRPPGFPSEYQVDLNDCYGKSINTEADTIGEGSKSCKVSVTATPYSDGVHTSALDITYCTVEVTTENNCTTAAPRHLLVNMVTRVPWAPGQCFTLCVEPLTFLPVDSETGTTFDPTLVRTSTVYNGSEFPLTITADTLQNSDGVFDVHPLDTCLGKTIPPGGECAVSVRLHDDGKPHLRTSLVVTGSTGITCDSEDSGPPCEITGIGSVVARPAFTSADNDLYADPVDLDLGSATVGTTTAPKAVTLTGFADVSEVEFPHPQWNRVIGVQVFGANAADFHADSSDCLNKDINIDAGMTGDGFTVAGVPSCKLSITATPSAAGMRQAYVDVTYCTVDDNEDFTAQADCFDRKTPRHVLVALSALGVAVPPATGCHALCVEPLDFLPPPEGTDPTTVRTSAVFNGTGSPVTVTAESFVNGANRFDVFPGQTCIGRTLPAGGECAVSVRYNDDGAVHSQAELRVDGVHPATGGPVTGLGAITVRTASQPDNDLYAKPSLLDFGDQTIGKRSAPLSVTLTGWGTTAAGPIWYRVLGVSVYGSDGTSQPGDYRADGSDCADKALNLKAAPPTNLPGAASCAISVTDLPPAAGVRPAGLDISYCKVTSPTAPCDGTTMPGHVLVGLTATGVRPPFHPKLTASPAVSPAARVVHITGSGFPANAGFVLALTPLGSPAITDPEALGKLPMKAAGTTDGNGGLSVDLLIMPNTITGTYPLQAVAVDKFGDQGAAQLGFLIVPGTQQVVPGTGGLPPKVLPRR